MQDWKDEGAQVFLSGETAKASQGYILLEWDRTVPANFLAKMHIDVDILDYFILGSIPAGSLLA
jgi:hypothetical protein